ncbi:subtilisin-like protease [Metarhizium album ARSEF 1941]|uniref:Subtilisin-like protease n=1 Tax=Metarhizium album (strain ARSEF 1941) TaxID=1081103 RepID=A0A0B2WVC5_METAS|nr:subtilisin-like protease [Metarhizium album ARSEF 1941]KHN97584.1 subtilisin-like protease [Metarhizium album ARSEF 1941]
MDLDFELFRGVSVQLHDLNNANNTVEELAALPGIKRHWPITLNHVPDAQIHWTGSSDGGNYLQARDGSMATGNFSPHVMTQIDRLHAKGYTGKGVHIAVIDTGIDYKHPSLGGCFGKRCLVTTGFDFVGDNYDGTNTKAPDNDPMDCQGHGSHVAGIIAATDKRFGFTGGAPGATLGAYRIFGCSGSVSSDVIIAAINRAYQDKADIVTLSIGGASGWKQNAWAVAASRIVDKGVIVTMSAGNAGSMGIFYAGTGSSGSGVASVASYNNVRTPTLVHHGKVTVGGNKPREFRYVPGNPNKLHTMSVWVDTTNTSVAADLCSPLPAGTPDLSRYVVLIRRGTCAFSDKILNAAAKGARHVMFYNSVDSHPTYLNLKKAVPGSIQGIGFVDKKTGEAWVEQLEAGNKVTLAFGPRPDTKFTVANVDNPTSGGAVSNFSTWGPTWTMDVKPQFGAPGSNILSTYPRAKGNYAVLSGTSMACPLTAAIYALLAEVRGTKDPVLLQNLLSASAKPQVFNDGDGFHDRLAPVAQQGAGLVQAHAAAFATTLLEPASLSFNETAYFDGRRNFTLTNHGDSTVTYNISYVAALTAVTLQQDARSVGRFPGELRSASADLRFSQSRLALGRGEKATIDVLATHPDHLDASRLPLWSGYVRVNGTDGTSLSLPYQGLAGSLRGHRVIGPGAASIARGGDQGLRPVPAHAGFRIPRRGPGDPARYTITAAAAGVLPAIVFEPLLGSRLVQLHVAPVSANGTTARPVGQVKGSPAEYVPRGRQSRPWDGQLDNATYVPAGEYRILVRMLRLYGDENDPKHWDESATQPFAIRYA